MREYRNLMYVHLNSQLHDVKFNRFPYKIVKKLNQNM